MTVQSILVPGPARVDDRSGNGYPAITRGNYAVLNPFEMGGRLASYAGLYKKFVFRRVKFIMIPSIVTGISSSQGDYCLGYSPDAALSLNSNPPLDFTAGRMYDGSCTTSRWVPDCSVSMSYTGQDTFYTGYSTSMPWDESTTTPIDEGASIDAQYRATSQGLFYMFSDGIISSAVQGYVDIEYEIEFYYATPPEPVYSGSSDLALDAKQTRVITTGHTVPGIRRSPVVKEDSSEASKKPPAESPLSVGRPSRDDVSREEE